MDGRVGDVGDLVVRSDRLPGEQRRRQERPWARALVIRLGIRGEISVIHKLGTKTEIEFL